MSITTSLCHINAAVLGVTTCTWLFQPGAVDTLNQFKNGCHNHYFQYFDDQINTKCQAYTRVFAVVNLWN